MNAQPNKTKAKQILGGGKLVARPNNALFKARPGDGARPYFSGNGVRNVRPSVLKAPKVKKALRRWLVVDQVTYAVAQRRLIDTFGIKVSDSTICTFWQRECQPREKTTTAAQPANPLLLDVVLLSKRPIRVRVFHIQGRLRCKVGPIQALRGKRGPL